MRLCAIALDWCTVWRDSLDRLWLFPFLIRPDEESVEKGQEMVEHVLNPYSDAAVQQKEKQMRELAIINGTLKEEEAGFNPANWGNAAAKGALFNPSRAVGGGGASAPAMDDEYASFMAELGGGDPPHPPAVDASVLASQAPWAKPESDGGIGGGMGNRPPPAALGPRPPAPWANPQGGMPPRPPPAPPGPYGMPPGMPPDMPPGMPPRPPGPPGWQGMPPRFPPPHGYPPMGMMRPPGYGPPGYPGAPAGMPPAGYPMPPVRRRREWHADAG